MVHSARVAADGQHPSRDGQGLWVDAMRSGQLPWVCVALACVVPTACAGAAPEPAAAHHMRWQAATVAARASARSQHLPALAFPTREPPARGKAAGAPIAGPRPAPTAMGGPTVGWLVAPVPLVVPGALAHVDVACETAPARAHGSPLRRDLAWPLEPLAGPHVAARSQALSDRAAPTRPASAGRVDIWRRRRQRLV